MSPAELDKILNEAPDAIKELLADLSPKITEAASAVLIETQDKENAKPVVKVGMTLSIDLACAPVSWKVEASVSIRYKETSDDHVADVEPELLEGMGKGRRGRK